MYVTENRSEFLDKLQRARGQVKPGTPSQPVLSAVAPSRIMVGNWALTCKKEGELHLHNSDGQQVCLNSVEKIYQYQSTCTQYDINFSCSVTLLQGTLKLYGVVLVYRRKLAFSFEFFY